MSEIGIQPRVGWCSPSSHLLREERRMTESPDSACETSTGDASVIIHSPNQVTQRAVSPFIPPPPPPPPSNGFIATPNVIAPWIDSDGDSGIIRLGSTSSSETDHSSSGFPDNHFIKLQVKHFNWSPKPPSINTYGPIRGDHTIHVPPAHPTDKTFQPRTFHQPHHSFIPPIKPLSWQCQRSMSVVDVHRNFRPNVNYFPPDGVSSCSCHKACVHCGNKFTNRSLLRSTSDIPSRLTVKSPNLDVGLNINKIGSQDSVFTAHDLIKVHARPVSVIPESTSGVARVTPRQAKSADAMSRQRRLQKAFSMTSALDYDDFINAHARVASVIPMARSDKNFHQSQTVKSIENIRLPVSTAQIYVKRENVTSQGKLTQGNLLLSSNPSSRSISSPVLRVGEDEKTNGESKEPNCEPPVTYAKVNKSHKGNVGKISPTEGTSVDDNEPPLPPRNYRSDSTKGNCSRSSLAEKVQGFTRSAKGVLRKAFGFNEREGQTKRNHRIIDPQSSQSQPLPVSVNSVQRTRSVKIPGSAVKINDNSSNYTEI